MQNLKLEWD